MNRLHMAVHGIKGFLLPPRDFRSQCTIMAATEESEDLNYKKAVSHLNALQSNAQTIIQMRERRQEMINANLKETSFYLKALGISDDKLDALNAIHVSGTKGKGSTCAFTESILRNHGLKTGFYSSPHLVHVRERIRINGAPLSKKSFSNWFFKVYDTIHESSLKLNIPMPAYFKFLTLMAFYTFLEENVDVVIVEVGIGGEHDCTNVLRSPVVCGITTLDIDHTLLLGSTIPEIAWHKAGIMKPNRPCFTGTQLPEAWQVFRKRADERSTTIHECQPFQQYKWSEELLNRLKAYGQHQCLNIALALQLSRSWFLDVKAVDILKDSDCNAVPANVEKAILTTHWAGRNHVLKTENITYYLDGAHTPKSIECCMNWFNSVINEKDPENAVTVLLFHCTADRDPQTLLPIIAERHTFQIAIFCPPKLLPSLDLRDDNANLNQLDSEQCQKCLKSRSVWKSLNQETICETFSCVRESLDHIRQVADNNQKVNVLITGSLHLVGNVLSFEDPKASL